LGTHLETGETYAVKLISKLRLKDRAAWDLMRSEVLIMYKLHELNHVNHIQLKEHFEDETTLFLVMECATGGELFDQIIKKRRFSEREAARVACQMFEAVRALHNLSVVHAGICCMCLVNVLRDCVVTIFFVCCIRQTSNPRIFCFRVPPPMRR
jgi:serine/threonine protein kinase